MRKGNRVLFASFVGILVLLVAIPLLYAEGARFWMGLLPMVVGLVLFVAFWGVVLKLIRRR